MDTEGYERIVMDQKDRIYSYAVTLLRDTAESQDVAQEALVRLWQHRRRVEAEWAGFWLLRTVHNLSIDRIRRRKSRPTVVPEQLEASTCDPAPGPQRLAEAGELGRSIEEALGELSEIDRSVVVLREMQGLSYDEIAEVLGLPLGTLKARLHRARHSLRDRLVRAGVAP